MSYIDIFTLTTAFDGTTQARTGYGFAPGALIAFGNCGAGEFALNGNARFSFGVAASAASESGAWCAFSDANATGTSFNGGSSVSITGLLALPGGPTTVGRWSVNSFDSDGATFIVDANNGTGNQLHVLAIPASRIANAEVGIISSPASPGTQSVSLTGSFAADVVLFFRGGTTDTSSGTMWIGAAARAGTTTNAVTLMADSDGSDPTVSISYSLAGECIANGLSLSHRAAVSSWSATGFTLNWLASASGVTVRYLALKAAPGYSFELTSGSTATDTNAFTLPLSRTNPDSGLVVSACRAQSSAGTSTAHGEMSVGAFAPAGADTQISVGFLTVNNVATTDAGLAQTFGSAYSNLTNPPGASLDGEMSFASGAPRQISFQMDNPDPSPSFFWALVSGTSLPLPRGAPIFF